MAFIFAFTFFTKVSQVLNFFGVKELKELSLRLGVKAE